MLFACAAAAGCATGGVKDDEDSGVRPGSDAGPVGCASADECDDGIPCSVDECDPDATCAHRYDDALCEPSEMCVPERGCVLRPPCEVDADCDDGQFCNGVETCDVLLGCQTGPVPTCDDTLGCTDDACDMSAEGGAGACAHTPRGELCADSIVCNGDEACVPGASDADANGCVPGAALDCDDTVPCTVDTCSEEAMGCEHTPMHSACDDGIFCNGGEMCDSVMGCTDGAAPACDDAIACTDDRCDAAADSCLHDPVHARCVDALVCNGSETCDVATGCRPGTPRSCDDGMSCTTDRCTEPGICEHLGSDADGDGYIAIGCSGGNDCDDLRPTVNPGGIEVCDGIDNNCSGTADDGAGMQCALGSAPLACTTSCGSPGTRICTSSCTLAPCVGIEICNACDDDGDGMRDEGFACERAAGRSCTTACATPGTQTCASDCSGYSTCSAATESCNDCDDDRDTRIDEGFTCRRGTTRSCTSACGTTGSQTCALDCGSYGTCAATEVCNGCDDDADGVPDDGFACRLGQSVACTTSCGTAGTQACNATCSGFATCRAAAETCGNLCDDDGNGMIDDGCTRPEDRCVGAITLSGRTGTRTDSFAGLTNTAPDACASGSELWYTFTLASRQIVYFDTFGSTFDTKISLRTSCTGAFVQCEDDDCATVQEQLVRVLDPGVYYIAVHAFSAATTSGTVSLRWQQIGAGNGAYTRITTNGTYTGTTSGSGTQATACRTASGPEAGVYFTMCPATTRTVTAQTCTGTTWDSVLELRGAADMSISCDDDSCALQSRVTGGVTGPGVFAVQVDGYSAAALGAYSLLVSGL